MLTQHLCFFFDEFKRIDFNPFMPTVALYPLRYTPFIPLRDDSAPRARSSLRGLRGAPVVPPLGREKQSLGQQMLNATVGKNGLKGAPLEPPLEHHGDIYVIYETSNENYLHR